MGWRYTGLQTGAECGKERGMAFDFKKEYREFYLPKDRPEIVAVPAMHYMAVRGQGDPNQPEGAYQQAIQMLYTVAYTLKMSGRAGHEIDGFFDYVVPPLEGFWQQGQTGTADKAAFRWVSVIRLPDFVTEEELCWAKQAAWEKKKLDCGGIPDGGGGAVRAVHAPGTLRHGGGDGGKDGQLSGGKRICERPVRDPYAPRDLLVGRAARDTGEVENGDTAPHPQGMRYISSHIQRRSGT